MRNPITARPLAAALLAAVLLSSCTSETPEEHNKNPDAAPLTLEAPRLLPGIPTSTPLTSVALRGRATGTSIVVSGGASGPLVKLPLPSGDFCVDVPLQPGAASTLHITALADGLVSAEVQHTVTQGPGAPQPANPYCDPPACSGPCPTTETDCADGNDNDLDGWTDECDTDCQSCTDDAFEPNDFPANVPILHKGETHDFQLCPCHDDWFAFFLLQGQVLDLDLQFDTKAMNIDVKLFKASDAEGSGYKSATPVAKSTWKLSQESITWTATATDVYYLYVYGFEAAEAGPYKLIVH